MLLDIGGKCTGCNACAAVCPNMCISMQKDDFGFAYPRIQETNCIQCGLCKKVCPVLTAPEKNAKQSVAYAAYTKNESIRCESSSGGIFSVISHWVLEHGGVVYGAAYNEKFKVEHICVEAEAELYKLRGAKYAQSNPKNCFPEIRDRLKNGQKVLYAGVPCQVAGLKSFLRKPYSNLFTIDFVCHGVPSPLVWEKYVEYRAEQDNGGTLPETINLRSKSTGWSKYQYSNEYRYKDGKLYTAKSSQDLFMRLFVGDYINRESCTDCHFKGYDRCSDLTLGDFWGIWDIAPDMDDNKGTSLVVIHSDTGLEMIQKNSSYIVMKEVTLKEASAQNPSMLYSSPANKKREKMLQMCASGKFVLAEKYFQKTKATQSRRLIGFVRRILQKIQ